MLGIATIQLLFYQNNDMNSLSVVKSAVYSFDPVLNPIIVPTLNIWSVTNHVIYSSIYTRFEYLSIMLHRDDDLSYIRHFDLHWSRTQSNQLLEFSFGESYIQVTESSQMYVLMIHYTILIFKIDLTNIFAPIDQIRKHCLIFK